MKDSVGVKVLVDGQRGRSPTVDASALLTVKELAAFLRKSARWVWYNLKRREDEPGSIPHVKLGKSPRFIFEDVQAWVAAGFPPAATFKAWRELESRRRRSS
jgi:hypothetical protein